MTSRHTYTRRQILGKASAVAAAAVASGAGRTSASAATLHHHTTSESVDVLIVGSGYAGAVAALRLAQAGVSSLLLERGRRWPITSDGDTFATPAAPDGRAAWLSTTSPFTSQTLDVYPGVLEAFQASGVTALAGAGVGGSSLVNSAVMMQPAADLFQRSFGSSLSYREMTSIWYPRARDLIGLSPMPDDVFNSSYYTAARDWAAEASNAGFSPERVGLAIDWDIVRQEIAGTAIPSAIVGNSIWGMNSGAKRSVDHTILAAAEATGRTTVQPLTQVMDIKPIGSRYQVSCRVIDESGAVVSQPVYAARHVFLAAGSLGTTRLLVRSRAIGSLPLLSSTIGSGWGTNGDLVSTRVGMPYNNPSQGGPSGIAVKDWDNSDGPITLLNFPAHPASGGGLAELTIGFAAPLGQFAYDSASDSVALSWPSSDPDVLSVKQALTSTLDKLNAANPGTSTAVVSAATTSHCCGGVGLGAIDADASLSGYPNLRVIDSSLLPGTTGAVPPALTVTAIADRMVTAALHEIL